MNSEMDPHGEVEQDLFDKLYFGTASEAELQGFAQRMRTDQAFADRYAAYSAALNELHKAAAPSPSKELGSLRERLRAVDDDLDRQTSGLSRSWYWAAAAMLAITVGAIWWRSGADERLAEAHAIKEPGLPVLMGSGTRRYDAIMSHYKLGQYAEAQRHLDSLLSIEPGNDTLVYFDAVLKEQASGCDEAVKGYLNVPLSSGYYTRAQFHAAICQLRTGDRAGAQQRLRQLQSVAEPELKDRITALLDLL